jgi:hypothetical protein
MRVFKGLEEIGKHFLNYSRIVKGIHYMQNKNNNNAVFIWIPKNAGTSIYKTLKKYGCLKAKKLQRVKYRFSQKGLVTFGHMDYNQLVNSGYVSAEFDKSAFKFCFSRNPYDRAVSLYEYFKPSLKTVNSFSDFIRLISERGVKPIGLYNSVDLSSCNPQIRWIEHVKIDYLGSYENLNSDFNRILNKLGLPETNLFYLNKSKRKDYRDYLDKESKELIESFYAEDFEYFNYPKIDDDDNK